VKEKVLSEHFSIDNFFKLDVYLKHNGYQAVKKALTALNPDKILKEVKAANLRGRGGAGFPAGVKWGFVPQNGDKPKYLCVNADEGEPGTIKDRYIMTLETAIDEAIQKGFLGKNILGSGFDLNITVHRGAGAYICGEETALLESLEGKRGNPRLKPPFPASIGLFQCPTVINNVETLSNIPSIILKGADRFCALGLPNDGGTRIFGVSGMVENPGIYELPVGTSLKDLIFKYAGGIKEGKKLKAVIPGGMSSPILKADEIDITMDSDTLMKVDSMLGSGAVIVLDEDTSILDVLKIITKFYAHESCGQCTPCRIGNTWIKKIVSRISRGEGKEGDIDNIIRLASNMLGKTLCPLGDAAAMPILSIVKKFRDELETSIK